MGGVRVGAFQNQTQTLGFEIWRVARGEECWAPSSHAVRALPAEQSRAVRWCRAVEFPPLAWKSPYRVREEHLSSRNLE